MGEKFKPMFGNVFRFPGGNKNNDAEQKKQQTPDPQAESSEEHPMQTFANITEGIPERTKSPSEVTRARIEHMKNKQQALEMGLPEHLKSTGNVMAGKMGFGKEHPVEKHAREGIAATLAADKEEEMETVHLAGGLKRKKPEDVS